VFVIAEAGVNHNGDVRLAHRLVDAAVAAGADAVKFQTFKAERLATSKAPKAPYQRRNVRGGSQLEMLRRLELSHEDHRRLLAHCKKKGILFMSSPFDEESAIFLASLPVDVFKVPSGELTNIPFLSRLARMGKPMIVSTGMATLGEVRLAVKALRPAGGRRLILLHCVSAYPADPKDANVRAMETLARTFRTPVGFSDHTPGISVSLAAVALGACVIEKHITLDQRMPGPDHKASLSPEMFASLVREVRVVKSALGNGQKVTREAEADVLRMSRKSLVAARCIRQGERLSVDDVASRRPGTGVSPAELPRLLGRVTRRDIPFEALLSLSMFR
jgi:N,N'-diacetyllegionaminate synthase